MTKFWSKHCYYGRSQATKDFGTMNMCFEKGACLSIQTRYWDFENKTWNFTYWNDQIELYKAFAEEFKQTSAGMWHKSRCTLVVDIDTPISDPLEVSRRFPVTPNMYNYNSSNSHCQYYWFLDDNYYYDGDNWYKNLYRCMNSFENLGDLGFTGWQIRNPFFQNDVYSYEILETKKYTKKELEDAFEVKKFISSPLYSYLINNVQNTRKLSNSLTKGKSYRNSMTLKASIYELSLQTKELTLEYILEIVKNINSIICEENEWSESPEAEMKRMAKWLHGLYQKGRLRAGYTEEDRARAIKYRQDKMQEKIQLVKYAIDTDPSLGWKKNRGKLLKHMQENIQINICRMTLHKYLKELKIL